MAVKSASFGQETGPFIAYNPFNCSSLVLIENLCSCPLAHYYFRSSFSVCSVPSVTEQAGLLNVSLSLNTLVKGEGSNKRCQVMLLDSLTDAHGISSYLKLQEMKKCSLQSFRYFNVEFNC